MKTQLMPELYADLLSICSRNDSFFWKDVYLDNIKYRIFSYRLGSYDTFQIDAYAVNCRGIMFNINDPVNIKLVSLPTEKFYNYEEGPGYKKHELGTLGYQMEKVDGVFMSTFLHVDSDRENALRLKTKISIQSPEINDAMKLLTDELKCEMENLAADYTINLEYTSPSNRVVIDYPEPQLTITSIRSHLDGKTLFAQDLTSFLDRMKCNIMLKHIVGYTSIPKSIAQNDFVNNIRQETEGEGYVVQIIAPDLSSYLVKIKTHKYVLAYQSKETIKSKRRLFESIINEQSDDLRSLFYDNVVALSDITEAEKQVIPIFNRMVNVVETFYDEHKHLSKDLYEHCVQNDEAINIYRSLLLQLHEDGNADYKQFAIDHPHIFEVDF